MNVYDFDHTVYRGDSSVDFSVYCMKNHPVLLLFLPLQCLAVAGILTGILSSRKGKEWFFCFLKWLKYPEKDIVGFWETHRKKLQLWYLSRQKNDDLIISASPYFLLEPLVCGQWRVNLIATDMDPGSGCIAGKNCKGQEKVRLFKERFGGVQVEEFYSDSRSDTPMAELAQRAYLVKLTSGDFHITPW